MLFLTRIVTDILSHCFFLPSLGTADVIFESASSASAAIRKYHNVPLDGAAMNIQYAVSEASLAVGRAPATPARRIPTVYVRGEEGGGGALSGRR